MDTATENLPQLRLNQLISPALPIGAFTYSQGLEWAVEAGWVKDARSLECWLSGLLQHNLPAVDLAILKRLYRACERADQAAIAHWNGLLLACRESAELRAEEQQRGRALANLLREMGLFTEAGNGSSWRDVLSQTQAAGFAFAALRWQIPLQDAALGYAWSWLENQVSAGVKLIPLGQTAGQRLLLKLAESLPAAVQRGLRLGDDQIGASAPALALASARHETQYTRLFRS